jgi:hypothetical protein
MSTSTSGGQSSFSGNNTPREDRASSSPYAEAGPQTAARRAPEKRSTPSTQPATTHVSLWA